MIVVNISLVSYYDTRVTPTECHKGGSGDHFGFDKLTKERNTHLELRDTDQMGRS